MDGTICYLNTDLDLTSAVDLAEMASAFEAGGARALYLTHGEDGLWYATLETNGAHDQPETNIAEMLVVIESFEAPIRAIWTGCSRREFNIGYDCGDEPWAFNQGLSSELLGRIAAAGASLRITLYPARPEGDA